MPIFRYDSDGYPSGTSGDPEWKAISNIYRWTGSAWQKIKKIYRFNDNIAAKWQLIFQGTDAPQPQSPFSSLYRTSDNGTTTFSSGNTVRLSRGSWTNSPTSYRLRIQTSQDQASNYTTVSDQTYNSSSTPTAANTTNDTYISYTITDSDALYPSYYIRGLVQATNADGTTPLETSAVLLRIGFTLSNLAASSPTAYGGTFSWSISGVPNQSEYIWDQTLTIRRVSDNVVVKTVNIPAGTNSTVVNDSVNISPNTNYYAKLVVTAFDSWYSTASPTTRTIDNILFTTAGNPPVNTVAPTIGPLNNRGYLPVSTTLTATQGTWNNVSGTTTYAYDWYKEDYITGSLSNTGYTGNTQSYSTSDVFDYIFVRVRATNTDGGVGTALSTTYTLDQAVAVGNITPTSVIVNTSNTFSFNISHYPTSYVVDWGDGTSNSYTVSANTSTVNASIAKTYTSTGNKTVTITAQPGNKTSTTTVGVTVPTPTVSNATVSDITTTPSAASSISVSGSTSNIATLSWTNGSPATSINVAYSGAGTNGNYTDSSSPFDTSTTLNYSSSATIFVTITTYNNNKQARISWNQTNAASYAVTYTLSGLGGATDYGNSSASSVNYDITLGSISRTVTLNSITVYSGANQTGVSNTYNFSSSVTPTDKSSVGSGSGSVTYYSPPPSNTSIPTLSPTTISVGTLLTAGVGSWTNSPTSYDIRIYRGTAGVIMSETLVASGTSTSLTYTVTQADYNSGQLYFRTYVNATNSGGSSGFVAGQERGPIQISAPVNTVAPSVTPSSGTAGVTQFSSTTGSWSNSPTSYSYQWRYLDQGSTWLSISGATSSTYTPPSNYVSLYGSSLRCYVTASNGGGSATANSNTVTVSAGGGGSAPATPTGVGLSGSGVVSWTASSGATSYEIEFYTAQSGSGLNAAGPYTVTGISASPYQLVSPYASPNNWARVRVRARNSNGASAYSAWVPSATTYT